MNFYFRPITRSKQLNNESSPNDREDMRERRPFLLVLSMILGIFTIYIATNSARLTDPLLLAGFVATMLIHIGLYWLVGYSLKSPRLTLTFISIQGLLGMAAILISGAPEMALVIFTSLIGVTIGTFGNSRLTWAAVFVYFFAAPLSFFLLGSADSFDFWINLTIPLTIILIIFVVLFRRLLETGQQAKIVAIELEKANRQLLIYAAQVEELTRTAERRRIARDLHDTLAQGVAGLVLQLEAAKANLKSGNEEKVSTIINLTLEGARSTLSSSRAAIDDLRAIPKSFSEAVHEKIDQYKQSSGSSCELILDIGEMTVIPSAIEQLMDVINEAFSNITKHAQASKVWVAIEGNKKQLVLEIRDNGKGFEIDKLKQGGHYGLLGLQERAQIIGGTLEIESEIGTGTAIRLLIPGARIFQSKVGTE